MFPVGSGAGGPDPAASAPRQGCQGADAATPLALQPQPHQSSPRQQMQRHDDDSSVDGRSWRRHPACPSATRNSATQAPRSLRPHALARHGVRLGVVAQRPLVRLQYLLRPLDPHGHVVHVGLQQVVVEGPARTGGRTRVQTGVAAGRRCMWAGCVEAGAKGWGERGDRWWWWWGGGCRGGAAPPWGVPRPGGPSPSPPPWPIHSGGGGTPHLPACL